MPKGRTRLVFRIHAIQRMFQRQVNENDVRWVIQNGETVEQYPDDTPYPSRLLLGWRGARPLHVVVAYNEAEQETIVITVYEPDPLQWDATFKRRVK